MNAVRNENPNVDAKVLEVDAPKTAPAANAAAVGVPGLPRVAHLLARDLHAADLQRAIEQAAQVHVRHRIVEERHANIRQRLLENQLNIQRRLQIIERDREQRHERMQNQHAWVRARNAMVERVRPVRPVPAVQPVQPVPPMQPFQMPPGPPNHRRAVAVHADDQPHPALRININANHLPPNARIIINHNQQNNNRPPNNAHNDAGQIAHANIQIQGNLQQRLAAMVQAAPVAAPRVAVQAVPQRRGTRRR